MTVPAIKIARYLTISISVIILSIIAANLLRWKAGKIVAMEIPKITSDLKIQDVHLTRAVAGKTEWELKARSADYFKEKGVTGLEFPEGHFFGKGGQKVELKGDRGEVYNDTDDVLVSGNVTVKTGDGYTLHSDDLRYYSEKKMVTTDSVVTITGNGMEVEGKGMEARLDSGRVVIKKDVRAVLMGRI